MRDSHEWDGLPAAQATALAVAYEQANSQALRQARMLRGNRSAAVDRLVETRRALREALRDELRDLGCPPHCLEDVASSIVIRAVRRSPSHSAAAAL